MGVDIFIEKLDTTRIKIHCEDGIAYELRDRFTFEVPGAKFMPAYRNKMWDGKIRLFNTYTRVTYFGLHQEIEKFASENGYSVDYLKPTEFLHGTFDISEELSEAYLTSLNLSKQVDGKAAPLVPRLHQLEAFHHCLNAGRTTLQSPTASGKSLILYGLTRFYLENFVRPNQRLLIIVPTTGLIKQLLSDFKEYSELNRWDVESNVHLIYEGQAKAHKSKQVYLSTWQSQQRQTKEYFDQFDAVLWDECHSCKSNCLSGILSKMQNTPVRHGTTGTLDGLTSNELLIQGLLGPAYKVISTKELMDKGLVSNLRIQSIIFKYPEAILKQAKNWTYQQEFDFLIGLPCRNRFIQQLTYANTGNTIVLCNNIEKQLVPLSEMIEAELPVGRKSYVVHGTVPVEERETIRKAINTETGTITTATFGTLSTGINIEQLHHLVLGAPYKSVIRILQSIGRVLRLAKNKNVATWWDLGDDLRKGSHVNTTFSHLIERLKIFACEEFEYDIQEVVLNFTEEDYIFLDSFK